MNDCPSTPAQKQILFAEKRREKVERHPFSHPTTLTALLELEGKDDDDDDDEDVVNQIYVKF